MNGMETPPLPDTLYKYCPFDLTRLRQTILRSEAWFTIPLHFNDPFDCRPYVDVAGSLDQQKRWVEDLIRRNVGKQATKVQVAAAEHLRASLEKHGFEGLLGTDLRSQALDELLSNLGVLSLSSRADSTLMWSHYAAQHKGVCLGFSSSEDPFSKALPVVYNDARPSYRLFDEDRKDLVETFVLRKAADWQYEREWRVALPNRTGVQSISPKALVRVIFGARMSEDEKDVLRWIVESLDRPVEILQASFDHKTFNMHLGDA